MKENYPLYFPTENELLHSTILLADKSGVEQLDDLLYELEEVQYPLHLNTAYMVLDGAKSNEFEQTIWDCVTPHGGTIRLDVNDIVLGNTNTFGTMALENALSKAYFNKAKQAEYDKYIGAKWTVDYRTEQTKFAYYEGTGQSLLNESIEPNTCYYLPCASYEGIVKSPVFRKNQDVYEYTKWYLDEIPCIQTNFYVVDYSRLNATDGCVYSQKIIDKWIEVGKDRIINKNVSAWLIPVEEVNSGLNLDPQISFLDCEHLLAYTMKQNGIKLEPILTFAETLKLFTFILKHGWAAPCFKGLQITSQAGKFLHKHTGAAIIEVV